MSSKYYSESSIIEWFCHVPNPSTDEEDATMALTIRATSPMNMGIHKNVETECIEVEHTHMQLFIIHNGIKHSIKQEFIKHVHHNH